MKGMRNIPSVDAEYRCGYVTFDPPIRLETGHGGARIRTEDGQAWAVYDDGYEGPKSTETMTFVEVPE